MNVQQSPKPRERFEARYNSMLGIQSYDSDNLYPQNVRRIAAVSATATTCIQRYIDFLEGNGIHSQALSQLVVNYQGEMLDDVLRLVCEDKAVYNGFALHVNYDANINVSSLQHIPFENCRLEEPDDAGFVAHVCIHPDWTGKKTRNGSRITVTDDNVDRIAVFDPDKEVVAAQILAAGGITSYKGQVLYCSPQAMAYPKAVFDAVLTDIITEEGLSNVKLRNVRNNFLPSGVFVHYGSRDDDGSVSEQLRDLQGDMNACKLIDVTIDNEAEKPMFVEFPTQNYDTAFTTTTADVKDNIYSAFGQEGWLCIRNGKVGFGGTVVEDIEKQYSRRCVRVQREITRAFLKVLTHWHSPLPEVATAENLTIEPLSSINGQTTTI